MDVQIHTALYHIWAKTLSKLIFVTRSPYFRNSSSSTWDTSAVWLSDHILNIPICEFKSLYSILINLNAGQLKNMKLIAFFVCKLFKTITYKYTCVFYMLLYTSPHICTHIKSNYTKFVCLFNRKCHANKGKREERVLQTHRHITGTLLVKCKTVCLYLYGITMKVPVV